MEQNIGYTDPEEESTPQDDSGWGTIPTDRDDITIKGDTPNLETK